MDNMNDIDLTLARPDHITSLATSAHLVQVQTKLWSATKTDKEVSAEVTVNKRAKEHSAKVVKNLFTGDRDYRALALYRQSISNWNKRLTWDWAGDFRCLPQFSLTTWLKEFRVHTTNYLELKDRFLASYEDKIQMQAFEQGDMFKRSDYPSLSEVDSRITIGHMMIEVPTSDFRSSVSNDLAEDLNRHYQREAEKIVKRIMDQSWSRLHMYVDRLAHACSDTTANKDGKESKPRVYQSTIDQTKELVDLLDSFNITKDPDLAEATRAIRDTLRGIDAEVIRESSATRAAIKSEISEVMNKFKTRNVFSDDDE